jgi:hypothetical protein
MKIFFSSKTKLIKLAEDERPCRLCHTPQGGNVGSLPVVRYSLVGEPTTSKNRNIKVSGCKTCSNTGTVKSEPPTYQECSTCKPGHISIHGVGIRSGIYRPRICPGCFNKGTKTVPVHGGGVDEVEDIPCSKCHGDVNNIPVKDCPTCVQTGTDKPGFVMHGEPKHNIICPTCKGSKITNTVEPYTPILQVKCPHDHVDTRTPPATQGASDKLGPYDQNYFEGQRLLPLKLLWNIRGVGQKYEHKTDGEKKLTDFDGTTPQQVGRLTPPVPPVPSSEEPSYLDFFSRTDLLNPDRQRTSSNSFKKIKQYFNSKIAKSDDSSNELGDEFFGRPEKSTEGAGDFDLNDFMPEGLSLDVIPKSKRTLNPEEQKRLHGGPITTRQVDESDMLRPFVKNPAKAIEKTKSMLKGQKSLSAKRSTMSKMFKGMKDLETEIDKEPDAQVRQKKHNEGLRPSFRGWRDNLQKVSENLDAFGQIRGALKKKLSPVIGKDMDPEIATALTAQAFRHGKKVPNKDGSVTALSQYRLGITEPMPYFKNDENWRETHNGFGCDHDPSGDHEPEEGCIIDYHNPADNPKEGVTTGFNMRKVVGKYAKQNGEVTLRTVGARLQRPIESGLAKQDLRGSIPKWTPENFGRIVELPAKNATCVANRIQREHYVVNHTVEPATERSEYTSLPSEETGIPGLSPEPVLAKEKIQFPEEIRQGGPKESVYVGNPLYQLSNPFSSQEVEHGMWANNPIVQHFAKQIKNGKRPEKFKPYTPEPKFNSQQMKTRPGLTGPPPSQGDKSIDIDGVDINAMFSSSDETPPKTSKREGNELNPVEENADDTYDTDKKLKVQKMQRTQVHMVEPSNASTPDITPDVPQMNYN